MQHRKHRFATDNSSQSESQEDSDSSPSHLDHHHTARNKTFPKYNHKFKDNLRRMHKFLTET